MALSKANLPRPAEAQAGQMRDPVAEAQTPLFWEYLTESKYDDGSPRKPCSILIFTQDGMLKGMLKDSNVAACLWVSATTLAGVFRAWEEALGDPNVEWRADRSAHQAKATRIKRTPGG